MANFWQGITPWKEEKGETFGGALQNLWGYKPSPAAPSTAVMGGPGVTIGGVIKPPVTWGAPVQNLPGTPGFTSQPYTPPTTPTPNQGYWGQVPSTWAPVAGRQTFDVGAQAANYPATGGYIPPTGGYPPSTPSEPLNVVSQGGYDFYYDPIKGWIVLGETGTSSTMTAYQQAQSDLANRQFAYQQSQPDYSLQIAQMSQQQRQAELAWQQQQWQQQLAQEQKNYLANLAAEPHSWLEYAAAAGQPPVIQPWMLPLMPQEYGMSAAGQQIPGWTAQNMTGMPNLINPSAQYQARMGPTAQQQYYGYQQADIGATPEESAWRLWSLAPPGGSRGLTQVR